MTASTPTSALQHLFPEGTTTRQIGAAAVAWDFGDLTAEYEVIRGSAAKIDNGTKHSTGMAKIFTRNSCQKE